VCGRALGALFAGAVGKDTVSGVWRKVKSDWDAWNARSLTEEPIVRLILDGTVVRVRLDRKATAISLLVVIGVRADGRKVLLSVKAMHPQEEISADYNDMIYAAIVLEPRRAIDDEELGPPQAALDEIVAASSFLNSFNQPTQSVLRVLTADNARHFSAEDKIRIVRRMFFTTCVAGSFSGTDFCLIFAP
jgi:Transposase, Mutator family